MTPNNQSVSGDAQNFGRPRQPMVHRPGPCWHGPNWSWPREIPDQRGRGTVGLWDELLHRIWGLGTSFAYGSLGRALNRRHLEPQRGTARTARAAYATCTHARRAYKAPRNFPIRARACECARGGEKFCALRLPRFSPKIWSNPSEKGPRRKSSPDHRRRAVAGYFFGPWGWWPVEITAYGLRGL